MSVFVLIVRLALAGLLFCSTAAAQQSGAETRHRLNMSDVDLPALIGDVAAMTGKTFTIHPQVRGKANIISQADLTAEEVFVVFTTTLKAQGYAVVPVGAHSYSIVPERQAVTSAPPTAPEQLRTAVLSLSFLDAERAAEALRPLLAPGGVIHPIRGSRLLIVVDYASNMERIKSALAELDQDYTVTRVIALEHIGAGEAARIINGVLRSRPDKAYSSDALAVAADGANSLIIHGAARDVERMEQIANQVDTAAQGAESPVEIIALNHAQAADIIPILQQLASRSGNNNTTIAAYEPGNALIIRAPPGTLREFTDIVARLDKRQAQVLVEAIIVEVTDSKARELGVQLALYGGGNSALPMLASSFASSPVSILGIAGALVQRNEAALAGSTAQPALVQSALSRLSNANSLVAGQALGFGQGGIFGAILNAVATDTRSRILSTPSILTLDNQSAQILVGMEIPVTSGEVLGSSNDNPFRTIKREDVGVELTVKPQISRGDLIRMEVTQSVSALSRQVVVTSLSSTEPVTTKREIKTSVLAEDGEVIVLGGLIQEVSTGSNYRIPFLGDIPILGALFRSKASTSERTNLMIFLRPVIVRDGAVARAQTARSMAISGSREVFYPTEDKSDER